MAGQPEFRGFWVDGFNEGFRNPQETDNLIRRVRAANCNAVIVQMRKRGDAHYFSLLEPWAANHQEGYDALTDLIAKCRAAEPRIQVHVWTNCHPIWPAASWPPDPKHALNRMPEIQTEDVDGNRRTEVGYGLDWGHPQASDWLYRVYMDIARRFDVDGLHFDYIRYTGEQWGYNPVSVERFNRAHGRSGIPAKDDPAWKQWRRDQVTQLVRKIYVGAAAVRPSIVVSAALITWNNGPVRDEEWTNSAAYRAVFQDWRGWMEEGILDLAIPMVYYARSNERYRGWYENWVRFILRHQYGRRAVIGVGNYLNSIEDTIYQIGFAREGGKALGVNFFSYAATRREGTEYAMHDEGFYKAMGDYFGPPVPAPELPWKVERTVGHLRGAIVNGDLEPLDWVEVRLTDRDSRVRTTRTDGCGAYAFANLPPGRYRLQVGEIDSVFLVSEGLVSTVNLLTDREKLVSNIDDLPGVKKGSDVVLMDKRVVFADVELGQIIVEDLMGSKRLTVGARTKIPLTQGDLVALSFKAGDSAAKVQFLTADRPANAAQGGGR